MFANFGWEHFLVLLVVGLVVLGPERLPGAMRWSANALRQARDYVSGATSHLRDELGPEFDELRGPISELQKLRGMTPRAALTKHLLDGDDSLFTTMSGLDGEQHPERIDPPAHAAPPASPATPGAPQENVPRSQPANRSSAGPTFDSDAT